MVLYRGPTRSLHPLGEQRWLDAGRGLPSPSPPLGTALLTSGCWWGASGGRWTPAPTSARRHSLPCGLWGDMSRPLGDGSQSQLGGGCPQGLYPAALFPETPCAAPSPSRSPSLPGEVTPVLLSPPTSHPRVPWHSLAFLGSPSPMLTVRVLPAALRAATSPCPLTKVTLRVPPPPQPSFFTRNCSLEVRKAMRPW